MRGPVSHLCQWTVAHLEVVVVTQLVKNSPPSMEREGSLTLLQGPYFESTEHCPPPHSFLL